MNASPRTPSCRSVPPAGGGPGSTSERRLPREVLLGMQHLLGALRRRGPGRAQRGPAASLEQRGGERTAGRVRQHQLVAQHRRCARQHLRRRHGEARGVERPVLAAWQTLPQEALHHQHRVALQQADEREAAVVEVADRLRQETVHVDVLVLQRVAQLVRQHQLVGGRQGLAGADGVHPLAAGPHVVEPGDVLLQQARAHRAQVGGRGQQAERLQGALVGAGLLRSVFAVQDLLDVAAERRPVEELERHRVAERDAAELGHLALELRRRHLLEAAERHQQRVQQLARIGCRLLGRFLRPQGTRRDGQRTEDQRPHGPDGHGTASATATGNPAATSNSPGAPSRPVRRASKPK